jgi:hypothetical protein
MKTVCTSFLTLALLAASGRSEPPKGEAQAKDTDKKPKPKFTISKETTYVTEPLDKDGYVDYVTALNKRLSKGVTPANNACVLLWKALGPHPEGATMPAEFFKWLGIQPPAEKGDYFLPLHRFAKERLKIEPGKPTQDLYEQQDRATGRPWTELEYPAIAGWLSANDKPLALIVQATQRSHYFSPLTPPRDKQGAQALVAVLLPAVQKCRELAAALLARSMLRLGQGNVEGAWQDLLACHRLGRLLARGGTLIEGLVGLAIDAIASAGDLRFLSCAKLDARRLKQCLRDLQRLPPMPPPSEKVDLAERFFLLESVPLIERRGLRYLEGLVGTLPADARPLAEQILNNVDWDPALRTANRWYDRLVAAMRIQDRAGREKKLDEIDKQLKELKARVSDADKLIELLPGGQATPAARGKVIGELLVSLLVPAVRKVQQADDRLRQVADNVTVAFALAWYQRDHGRYPKTLDVLAPKYLAKVPQDRFSGKGLIYRPADKGYLLYSVGVNGKDEGGQTYGDRPPGDDLPVRMPQPEPRK